MHNHHGKILTCAEEKLQVDVLNKPHGNNWPFERALIAND